MISEVDHPDVAVFPAEEQTARRSFGETWLAWPRCMWLFLLGVGVLYAPTLAAAAKVWTTNDNYAHGIFIFPVSAFLLWMQRDRIRQAERRPAAWSLALLAFGIVVQTSSYLLRIKYLGMWSLVLTLAGGVLLLHGRNLWKIACFPVCFLLFASPLPHATLRAITLWIQGISTLGSAGIMQTLGFLLVRHGNEIQMPGLTLEVAEACSGFHKLVSLAAFAFLYGYLAEATLIKRLVLIAAVVPVAIITNILRISSLIAAASTGGLSALHAFHDVAEIIAILLAFAMFVALGRMIGCKNTGLWQPSAV